MSYRDLALNQKNKKTIFIIVNYYDKVDQVVKKLYLSDRYFIGLDAGTSGNSITYEPRLDSIPFFEQEIDPISNEVIVKSSYKMKVINNDDYYKDILDRALFKNQKVEIYSYVEGLALADSLLLASASIEKFKKTNDTINFTLEDLSFFNKNITLDKFSSNDGLVSDGDLGKEKQILIGQLNNPEIINLKNTDDFVNLEGIQAKVVDDSLFLSIEDANKFREIVSIGDSIKIDKETNRDDSVYEVVDFITNTEVRLDGFADFRDDTFVNILFDNSNSYYANNSYFVSKKDKDYFSIIGDGGSGNSFLTTNQDLSFLSENDKIYIQIPQGEAEMTVDSFQFDTTNFLLFKEQLPIGVNTSSDIRYYYINKVEVNDTEFVRGVRNIDINFGDALNLSTGETQASADEGLLFTAQNQVAAADGNNIRVQFLGGLGGTCSDPNYTDADSCILFGGTWTPDSIDIIEVDPEYYQILFNPGTHTFQDVLDYYNGLSQTVKDNFNIKIEQGSRNLSELVQNNSFYLSFGGVNKSYILFTHHNQDIGDTDFQKRTVCFYFTVDGDNAGQPPALDIIPSDGFETLFYHEIEVNSNDLAQEVRSKFNAVFLLLNNPSTDYNFENYNFDGNFERTMIKATRRDNIENHGAFFRNFKSGIANLTPEGGFDTLSEYQIWENDIDNSFSSIATYNSTNDNIEFSVSSSSENPGISRNFSLTSNKDYSFQADISNQAGTNIEDIVLYFKIKKQSDNSLIRAIFFEYGTGPDQQSQFFANTTIRQVLFDQEPIWDDFNIPDEDIYIEIYKESFVNESEFTLDNMSITTSTKSFSFSRSEDFYNVFNTKIQNGDLVVDFNNKALKTATKINKVNYNFYSFFFSGTQDISDINNKNNRRISFSPNGSIPEDLDIGDYILKPEKNPPSILSFPRQEPDSLDFWKVVEIDEANLDVYIDRINTEYSALNEGTYDFYPLWIKQDKKLENFKVYYKDEHIDLSNTIKKLNNVFGITDFSQSDLDLLKDKFNTNTFLIIDESQEYYNYINKLSNSFSLSSYIDKSGILRYKFFNNLSLDSASIVDFNEYIEEETDYQEFEYSKALISYNKNFIDDEYINELEVIDSGIDAIQNILDFNSNVDIETNIISDIFNDTHSSIAFKDILTNRYFKNKLDLKILGKEDLLFFNLLDIISITNNKKVDSNIKFVVTKIKTNGKEVELTLTHFISPV